jgi:hypothetical protein
VVRVGEIPPEESPRRWLIEGLWGASAVGLIGGHPKGGKTFLALDIALSVASGTPCLGTYPVMEPGTALVYLAEDSLQDVRRRTEALTRHRGLALGDLDLHVITSSSLRLDLAPYRARLFRTVERIRPRLLVLDPLVRLHSRDENSATEIAELLSYLRALQRRLDVAVVLVHHARKSGAPHGQPGQSLRGSGDLWAWSDSALYLRRSGEHVILSVEHRAARAPDPVFVRLAHADEERVHLEVVPGYVQKRCQGRPSITEGILGALAEEQPLTREQLRSRLSVRNERLGGALAALERDGQIERGPEGWRVVSSP